MNVCCQTVTPPSDPRAFRRSLLRWYRRHGRDLPWRKTRDPYAILVSEFMLQQTQVATVRPYYYRWLERFPDFATLAAAKENDVLHAWQGLGYYRRARSLHAAARLVQDRHLGVFPTEISAIRDLPGVGRYTANAIATFSFDQSVPIVEANTARLVARLFDVRHPIDSKIGQDALWSNSESLLPRCNAAAFNSALMDLGATICLPRKPKCGICPVKKFCRTKNPESLPVKRMRPVTKRITETHAFIVRQNKLLLQKADRRWLNMWILPPLKLDRLKRSSSQRATIYKSVFPFTHHRVTLKVSRQESGRIDKKCQSWFSRSALEAIPIPSPHRRAITALLH